MPNRPEDNQPVPQREEADAKSSPSVTHWVRQPNQLQGARFKGPVAKITTVDSPIRPGRKT